MIEIISRRAIRDTLGYFSNPVSDFLLTYHSGFINGSETQYLASGGLEGQVQVVTAALIRNINMHSLLHCLPHDGIASLCGVNGGVRLTG
jgi:hypothetical protein